MIQTYHPDQLPPDLKWQILSYLRAEWPEDFTRISPRRDWLAHPDHHPLHMVIVDAGFLVSHAAVVWKYLDHAGRTYKVYGLGGVFTYPDYRGRGYGRQIIDAGTDYIRASDADVGMLFCEPRLKDFYAHSGWIPVDSAPTLVGPPDKPSAIAELRLMLFLSERGKTGREAFENVPVNFNEAMNW
jgi:GNAT superfamily N-acetyltransferase